MGYGGKFFLWLWDNFNSRPEDEQWLLISSTALDIMTGSISVIVGSKTTTFVSEPTRKMQQMNLGFTSMIMGIVLLVIANTVDFDKEG